MALLFMDSFDHYVTADLTEKWTSSTGPTISAGNGRRGTAALRVFNSLVSKSVAASGATAICGAAFKWASVSGGPSRFLGFHYGPTNQDQVYFQRNTDGSISAYRGNGTGMGNASAAVLGASTPGLISSGVVAFVECKILIHASAGTVTLRVNGATVLALTGVNTALAATPTWTTLWLFDSQGTNTDVDDLYLLDGSGSAPWNDFLGDCRVDARYPTAAGATTGWTPSTGANWAAVDDAAPNDDTDYTSAAAAGVTDTFVTQDAPVVGAAIYGVQHCLSAKKTDAGAASIAPVIRHGGTDFIGAASNPGTGYAYALQIAAVNPGTAAAWTEAGFNAAEFGYRRTV